MATRWRKPDKPLWAVVALLSAILVVVSVLGHDWWRAAVGVLLLRVSPGIAWNWTSSRVWPMRPRSG